MTCCLPGVLRALEPPFEGGAPRGAFSLGAVPRNPACCSLVGAARLLLSAGAGESRPAGGRRQLLRLAAWGVQGRPGLCPSAGRIVRLMTRPIARPVARPRLHS